MNWNAIVAGCELSNSSSNWGIGIKNTIPWSIPADMAHFKELTNGQIVIMGRQTWLSIPMKFRPLRNRINIVISTTLNLPDLPLYKDTFIVKSLEDAFENASIFSFSRQIFVIGGESIYNEAIDKFPESLQYLYLTKVKKSYEVDKYFPIDKYMKYLQKSSELLLENDDMQILKLQ
jgi:dihydrofolate reductase